MRYIALSKKNLTQLVRPFIADGEGGGKGVDDNQFGRETSRQKVN